MVKLRNFTLEGEVLTIVGHLDFETHTKPVHDIFLTQPDALCNLSAEEYDAFVEKMREELNEIEYSYDTCKLLERFRNDWKGAGLDGVPVPDLAEE